MNFLKEIAFKDTASLPGGFPFTLPVIESLDSLSFESPVTFFVGENGSGKSTLIEAIAAGMKCPTLGAMDISRDPRLGYARELASQLIFRKSSAPRRKLFFRAEDAIGFSQRVTDDLTDLAAIEADFDRNLSGYGRQLATGATRGQRDALRNRYGDNPDARSHGEWFLTMMKERIQGPGLFVLDEPETPLSPIHQLSLLAFIKQQTDEGGQFIVATHSPILMALPGATILEFDQSIQPVAWEDVEHVAVTRAFLNDPEKFMHHLWENSPEDGDS